MTSTMNNKLEEILQEFDKLTLGYCNDDELDEISYLAGQAHFKECYKKFLKEKLVEYAKNIIPPEAFVVTNHIRNRHENAGFDKCRYAILSHIDQDLQSLNN